MIELFKHITGIYRVDAEYIKLDNNITRGHNKRLKKQRASKIVRQNFLTFGATNTTPFPKKWWRHRPSTHLKLD